MHCIWEILAHPVVDFLVEFRVEYHMYNMHERVVTYAYTKKKKKKKERKK